MKVIKFLFAFLFLIIFTIGCQKTLKYSRKYQFPNYVNTESKPINFQKKRVFFTSQGVYATNDFKGARLNNFVALNDSTFEASIEPENTPINPSPWYAFKIWSGVPKTIYLNFRYSEGKNRYNPKLSYDGDIWTAMKDSCVIQNTPFKVKLNIGSDTTWIASQELFTTNDLNKWLDTKAVQVESFKVFEYGKSMLGKPLKGATLYENHKENKELIILMSRQHPPEVTGQMAFLHFVERLLAGDSLCNEFQKRYQIMIFPMQNPDGVDLGHWRHNAGGIDLNRDWDKYNQPETRNMAAYISNFILKKQADVVLGLDFHSTWEDIYYTNLSDSATHYPNFTKNWLNRIKDEIKGYQPNVAPSAIGQPVSKGWFFVNFNAVGITYEIGDNTSREFIKTKSEISAEKMMVELLNTSSVSHEQPPKR